MDAKTLAVSVAHGIASLPMDFYLGIERTFQDLNLANGGRNIQRRNFGEDERMYRALYIELGETLRKNPSKTEQFLGAIENL